MESEDRRNDLPPEQRPTPGRVSLIVLGALVALGALLRFYAIGRGSVWMDEAVSIDFARMPLGDFLAAVRNDEANMAFYHLLLRLFLPFGEGAAVVRTLSALCGVATIVLVYAIGRRLFDERVGLVAAALLSANVFHIWFSQEARGNSLAVLLVSVATYFFLAIVERPERPAPWIAYVASSALAGYSHVFAVFVIASHWLSLGPKRLRETGLGRIAGAAIAIAAFLAPLAVFLLGQDRGHIAWIPPTSLVMVLLTVDALAGFNLVLLGLLLGGLVWAIRSSVKGGDDAFALRLLGASLVFPISAVALVSLVKPLFFFRYFVVLLPAATILVARVLCPRHASSNLKKAIFVTSVLALAFNVVLDGGYYRTMDNWEGDWRSATHFVLERSRPGDALLFHAAAGVHAYGYYLRQANADPLASPTIIFPLPEVAGTPKGTRLVPERDALEKAAAGHPRLFVVLHHEQLRTFPSAFLDAYRKVEERQFHSLSPQTSLRVVLYERLAR
jgi:mannosyltransferase